MPKKKRQVETIKIEGLSSETVKEFEPREDSQKDDALWENYFKGTPNLFKLQTNKDKLTVSTIENIQLNELATLVTPVHTGVTTTVDSLEDQTRGKEQRTREEYISLDATHTAMEAKVYSVIYRETVVKGSDPQHFGASRLMSLTGIGSDKTIRKAIKNLIAKKSIALVDPYPNHPMGAMYKAFPPKEIISARKRFGIKIHPQTKKILSHYTVTNINTGVPTAVNTPVETTVDTQVKNTAVTPVDNTVVTPVKGTGVHNTTPYIYNNYINDGSMKKIESSSTSSIINDDVDDKAFNHRNYIISLYERYTGNHWRIADNEFYENKKILNIIPDIIEAAIIASVLRSKAKINSLAYCEGVIYEFQEDLPSGYLSYLRAKWKDIKERIPSAHEDMSVIEERYETIKKDIRRIVNIVRQGRAGMDNEEKLKDDVKAYCEKENVPFDEGIYNKIVGEHTPNR
ncbi:MAG: hypothetical protein L0Y68_01350 [Candidatus Dadabacteria bacterium]|nr:hypothetical protein [Candidatus Dadabacteria bacterium]